ncbi:MAG: acyl-CoA dehydrogenase [Alphaproteobacteria bacterium]|nr:acyl-CoA dehydrogenase [Alphaproteobacteria bacterium]
MTAYAPPLDDLRFLLSHVVDLTAALGTTDSGAEADDVLAALEEAGRLAADVIAPLNSVGDRHPPRIENGQVFTSPGWREAYRQFIDGGWNGIAGPNDHGGMGLPMVAAAAAQELWQSASMAFALCPMLTQAGIELLHAKGTEAQKTRYLDKLTSGEWTGTMLLTEPQAGSDVGALRTRAVRENGHYRLFGQKIYITYGDHDMTDNVIHMILARVEGAPPGIKGISLFVSPKILVNEDGSLGQRNDCRPVNLEHKLGIHGSPTCVMAFGDQEGAYAELIGEENRGIEYMFLMMNNARLNVGIQGVGVAERAYQHARHYARTRVQSKVVGRKQDGLAIIHHPDVTRMLAVAKARIQAARALYLEAATLLDLARTGTPSAATRADLLIPVVKAWSTDLGVDVASMGIQVHGGMGFVEETGAAQHYRDARIAPIYEGTNGIQANDLVARKVARDGGAAMGSLLEEITGLAGRLIDQPGDDLPTIGEALATGARALGEATDWVVTTFDSDPRAVLAGAVAFLDLVGTVVGGWMMGRAALAAQGLLAERQGDPQFAEAKIILARVYAEQVLVRAETLARTVTEGGRVLAALDEAIL